MCLPNLSCYNLQSGQKSRTYEFTKGTTKRFALGYHVSYKYLLLDKLNNWIEKNWLCRSLETFKLKCEDLFSKVLNLEFVDKFFLIAIYYFPGIDLKFFRIRYYTLYPCEFSSKEKTLISMEIYRVIPEITNKKIFLESYQKNNLKKKNYAAIKFSHCTVFWQKNENNKLKTQNQILFKGHLDEGGCSIFSIISANLGVKLKFR